MLYANVPTRLKMCSNTIAALGFAILYTEHHVADVSDTISRLRVQNVRNEQIMLFNGHSAPTALTFSPIYTVPNNAEGSLTKTYAWMMSAAAACFQYIVFIEDDLALSPNFVAYMRWGRRVMELDPAVAVVSAWNDNAVPAVKLNPSLVFKTNQFMGLGWAVSAKHALMFAAGFSTRPWDLTMSETMATRGLVSIFPQFPRVYHRTASFWKFDTLQVLNTTRTVLPSPGTIATNYKQYLQSICILAYTHLAQSKADLEPALKRSGLDVPWTTSSLTHGLYGAFLNTAVYADQSGNQHIFSIYPNGANCSYRI